MVWRLGGNTSQIGDLETNCFQKIAESIVNCVLKVDYFLPCEIQIKTFVLRGICFPSKKSESWPERETNRNKTCRRLRTCDKE